MKTSEFVELEGGAIVRSGRTLCFHRYGIDEILGVWRYRACSKCGRRRADRMYRSLMGPYDRRWVEGETNVLNEQPRRPPPKPPSGSIRP